MQIKQSITKLSEADKHLLLHNVHDYAQSYISKWDSTSRLKHAKLLLPIVDNSTILKGGEFILSVTDDSEVVKYLSATFLYHEKEVAKLGHQQGLSIMLLKFYSGCKFRKSYDGKIIVTKPELLYDQSEYRKPRKTKDGRPRFENNRNEFVVDRYK